MRNMRGLSSRIVLAAADGESDGVIAQRLAFTRETVMLWPEPWRGGARGDVGGLPKLISSHFSPFLSSLVVKVVGA